MTPDRTGMRNEQGWQFGSHFAADARTKRREEAWAEWVLAVRGWWGWRGVWRVTGDAPPYHPRPLRPAGWRAVLGARNSQTGGMLDSGMLEGDGAGARLEGRAQKAGIRIGDVCVGGGGGCGHHHPRRFGLHDHIITKVYGDYNEPSDADDENFVLVTANSPNYHIHGWIQGIEGKQKQYWQNWNNRPPAWFIPIEALNPIETLEV